MKVGLDGDWNIGAGFDESFLNTAARDVASAEFTERIPAPAVGSSLVGEPTNVIAAGIDGPESQASGDASRAEAAGAASDVHHALTCLSAT
jgi:hypothetical protein